MIINKGDLFREKLTGEILEITGKLDITEEMVESRGNAKEPEPIRSQLIKNKIFVK